MNTIVGARGTTAATWASAGRLRRRGLLLLGCLLAATMLAGTATAWATPQMAGEWELVLQSGPQTVRGAATITQEANAKGEFASSSATFDGMDPGTFSGTLGTTEAAVLITAQAIGPFPATEFTSNSIQIQEGSSLVLSGSGTVKQGSSSAPATLTATRIRTLQEIEEQREREQRALEEAEARESVRGEWELVMSSGPQVVHGVARITEAANVNGEFASNSALFEGAIPGSFTGKLEGTNATVTITTDATGPFPESKFTSNSITVTRTSSSMSMSGSGTIEAGGASAPATLTATRIKNGQELKNLEAQEKLERETREKQQQEAASTPIAGGSTGTTSTSVTTDDKADSTSILPVHLARATLAVSRSGLLSLRLVNPNSLAVKGRVTLVLLPGTRKNASAKHSSAKPKAVVLGVCSFTLSPSGHERVTVKLGKPGRALLARHKKLRVVARVRTEGGGEPATIKSYVVTLRAASHASSHH
jgi:hypothetical protein